MEHHVHTEKCLVEAVSNSVRDLFCDINRLAYLSLDSTKKELFQGRVWQHFREVVLPGIEGVLSEDTLEVEEMAVEVVEQIEWPFIADLARITFHASKADSMERLIHRAIHEWEESLEDVIFNHLPDTTSAPPQVGTLDN